MALTIVTVSMCTNCGIVLHNRDDHVHPKTGEWLCNQEDVEQWGGMIRECLEANIDRIGQRGVNWISVDEEIERVQQRLKEGKNSQ